MSVALLLLDPTGRILHASHSACSLWAEQASSLLHRQITELFLFEVVSSDPDMIEAQWEALKASSGPDPISLVGTTADGRNFSVSIQLEPLPAPQDGFAALIAPLEKPSQSSAHTREDNSLSFLSEHAGLATFDLDFAGGTVFYSAAWKKMLGYVDAELPNTYETWQSLLHPDDSSAAPDRLGRRQPDPGTTPLSMEFRMRHRQGRWVWIQCLGVRQISEDGKIARVSGIHLDITERKELEEAALISEERLASLGTDGPLGFFDFDFVSGTAWISPAFKRLVGYEDESLPNSLETFQHLMPAGDLDAGVSAWFSSQGITGNSSFVCPVRLQHREGRAVTVLLGASRRFSRKRELLHVIGFCCAIPADLAAIQTTAGDSVSTSLLTEALSCTAESVIITDGQGVIRYANPQAVGLLQLNRATGIKGQPFGDVFRLIHRDSQKPLDSTAVEMALAAEEPIALVQAHALMPPDPGTAPVPIVWSAKVLFGSAARADGVVVVFRNPDEISLSPEELVKANRYEALALLAGGIAHDFNNLLTTILGGISLAKDNRDYSALDDSDKSCIAAKALTRQLLAFVKGSSGVRTVCPPAEIIQDAIKIAAAGSTAQISVSVGESLPSVKVDRPQILQVFQNLIVNALQAMPPPPHKPRLFLSVDTVDLAEGQLDSLSAGTYLRFEVRDNGSGIPQDILERIWDPFFTTKKHGTGLGLATVLSIIRKHGGQIGVESQVGVGTVFRAFIPATSDEAEIQARRAPSIRFGTGRILFMDDDPKICAITSNMLQSLDYKFDIAHSGEEAIKLYRSYFNLGRPYDAVLMDLTVIGGMGGEETFRELKQIDPDTRAIACSGYDNEEIARRFLEMGFCGYLTKPYRVTDLGRILKTVLG